MNRFFARIYDYFKGRRRLLFAIFAVVVAAALYSALRLSFSEDISGFLPNDERNERVNYAYQHIGTANTIVVYFSVGESTPQAIDDFVTRLEGSEASQYIKKILANVDESEIIDKMRFISSNLPYFLDEADYAMIDTLITPENIRKQMLNDREMLGSLYGGMMKGVMVNDPLFISKNLLSGLSGFKMNDNFQVDNGYIHTKDGTEALVMVESKYPLSETANNRKLIAGIDKIAQESEFASELSIRPFGAAYISVSNADRIKKDSILTITLALILILVILVYSFRSFRIMILLPIVLLFGVLFAFGVTSALYSEISLIAVGIASVIIGIAANYPLHFIDHKYHGYGTRQTLLDITKPLTIGNITTIGAFLSLLFISSPAMRNLGVFASMLLVGTILFVLIVLPHIIPERSSHYSKTPKRLLRRLTDIPLEDKKIVVCAVFVLSLVFLFLRKAEFNADMGLINYMTPEHRAFIQKLTSDTEDGSETLYVVAEGESLDGALEVYENLQDEMRDLLDGHSQLRYTSIGNYLPSKARQKERLALWESYWAERDIYPLIELYGREAGFKEGSFRAFKNLISQRYEPQELDFFAPLTANLADNYLIEAEDRAMVLSVLHSDPEQETLLHQIGDSIDTIDAESVFTFSQDSIMSQVVTALSDDFDYVLYVCGFIVFCFLFLSFGRLELSLISFLPLALSWIWIFALMPVFGMSFNIVNIILATFIFGMGDDYTIFMTEGSIYEHRFGRKMLNTYKSTVALSAIIMFIGIGSLILAKHPAMRQLGEVVIVGMFVVVTIAFIIPPFFFKWLTVKKGKKRKNPVTIKNLSCTIFSFAVFIAGTIYLTLLGFFLLTIAGRSERNKLRYHRQLQKICGFVLRNVPLTKYSFINDSAEENPFRKPSVIICNHQSHLDLMAVISLTPKVIVFTNHWVWKSPAYGTILRDADFYPIERFDSGNPAALNELEQRVCEGYSLMIFPEGTRSADCSVQRFHKGAFHLAQQLGLDILPVMIHGFGYALPKEDLLLKKSQLTVRIMRRIAVDGRDTRELCKSTRMLYVQEYEKMCRSLETVDYYADEVICNYIYKGKEIESYVRKSLKTHDNYRTLVDRISRCDSVLLTNAAYGELPLLAALVCRDCDITALIEDEEAYLTAVNCPSVPSNLHYINKLSGVYSFVFDCDGEKL